MRVTATNTQLLNQALSDNGIAIDDRAVERILAYLNLIKQWNRVYNLTSITNLREMIYLHIIDSLVVLPFIHGKKCLDVGTGAGLPGIPLAIVKPALDFTLLDKTRKKTQFLTQAVAELQLSNVHVVRTRCEDSNSATCFDTILARAFASLTVFASQTSRLLCQGGSIIAMKGRYPKAELSELPDYFRVKVTKLAIKGIAIERHIVEIKCK